MTLQGSLSVPGDKSISHRALMFSAPCPGTHRIVGLLDSADVRATQACLEGIGVSVQTQKTANGELETIVESRADFREPENVLDALNSGTTIRLLSGLFAAQPFQTILTGDEALRQRPMGRVILPLRQMGARIHAREDNRFAPLSILPAPAEGLRGIDYDMPLASAQVKSALLLAGLYANGETIVREPAPSRDHTERMLRALGVRLEQQGSKIALPGGQIQALKKPRDLEWRVPGDFSSAAFFIVAGLLTPNSLIKIENVGLNPHRIGLMTALKSVGASIEAENLRDMGGEPVGDLVVESSTLKGDLRITEADVPGMIDEIPILAVAGVFLDGTLAVSGAEELRKKESDRLQAIADEFQKLGISMVMSPDGFVLEGRPETRLQFPQAPLSAHRDHRIAMSLSILNRVARPDETWPIDGREWVGISYPGFYPQLEALSRGVPSR